MNRRLSTENGRSPSRDCLIVLPWFWVSIGARRSISASIRLASLNRAAARSPGVIRGHLPLSNASRAASIAARASSTSACGTAAIFPPLAGVVPQRLPPLGGRGPPPLLRFQVTHLPPP